MLILEALTALITISVSGSVLCGANPMMVPYFEYTLRPCPELPPVEVDVDQLLGSWHLSLMLLDGPADDASVCARVDVTRANASLLHLDWTLRQLDLPAGLGDVRVRVPADITAQPGSWVVATPLGGEMMATVTRAAAQSHMVLTVCGDRDQNGIQVHVLTALLTRSAPSDLGALELVRLSRLMLDRGFKKQDARLLSWGQC